ncbi:MAG: hypothetical protein ACRDY0_09590 [Acidimicrobiales bacterium]
MRLDGPVLVVDGDVLVAFSFDDMLRFSGPGSPAGVALAYQAMRLTFPMISPAGPPQRRRISVETAFAGPGGRDAFELVTRAVTDGRYHVDPAWQRAERGPVAAPFFFRVRHDDRVAAVVVKGGLVSEEFVSLAGASPRSPEGEERLTVMKAQLAAAVLQRPAAEVFEPVA